MHLNVAAIVARGPASMHAARAATSTIPIVALSGTDPVAEGWAANLTRPGGNTTGLTVSFPALGTKRLEVLKQARPGLKRVAMMFEPAQITPTGRSDPLKAAASTLGLELQTLEVRDSADFLSPSSIMRDKVVRRGCT